MAKKPSSQHVVKRSDGWAVKKGGSTRATKVFSTQKEAVVHGRGIAKNQKAEFYVHGKDGKIREKDSYGKDPYPLKDKKQGGRMQCSSCGGACGRGGCKMAPMYPQNWAAQHISKAIVALMEAMDKGYLTDSAVAESDISVLRGIAKRYRRG